MLFGAVFPFLVIMGCNIIIIITIKRASAHRAKISTGTDQSDEKRKDQQHLTRMLIFVSLAYVVTSIPYRLYYMLMDVPAIGGAYIMEYTYWNLRYHVQVWAVVNLWLYNYAINFYLYCLGGGAKYRKDALDVCKEMFPCCCRAWSAWRPWGIVQY
jgi:hypothetical protein